MSCEGLDLKIMWLQLLLGLEKERESSGMTRAAENTLESNGSIPVVFLIFFMENSNYTGELTSPFHTYISFHFLL